MFHLAQVIKVCAGFVERVARLRTHSSNCIYRLLCFRDCTFLNAGPVKSKVSFYIPGVCSFWGNKLLDGILHEARALLQPPTSPEQADHRPRTHSHRIIGRGLKVLRHPPQAHRLGRHKQRAALDARLAVDGLDAGVDPDLPPLLAPLARGQLLVGHGAGAQDVDVGRQRGPLVDDVEVCGEHAAGAEVLERGARGVLVQQGGDGAAVDDAGPAYCPRAQVDDGDDLAGGAVVEDVLVGADAAGAGQGPRCYALGPRLGGDALVGLVVEAGPLRVREEVLHHGELGGGGADVRGEGVV